MAHLQHKPHLQFVKLSFSHIRCTCVDGSGSGLDSEQMWVPQDYKKQHGLSTIHQTKGNSDFTAFEMVNKCKAC